MADPTIKLVIDGAVAVGTIAVAVLAIWGEWIRSVLAPARLEISPVQGQEIRGTPVTLKQGGLAIAAGHPPKRAMWYTLKVVNRRPWLVARNCRVLLTGISRRGPDGVYRPETFPVPRQYWWAPSESTPTEVSVPKEHVFDLGFLHEDPAAVFTPTLYSQPNDFPGFVGINESVRYSLAISADNFHSKTYQVFEVSWDGQWDASPEIMAKHLTVREILREPEPWIP